ncbi:MAG: acyl carrier protein [Brevundimonas sp.]|nr:MAG: acyl carrier protein [Brevundimonas sp.]
MHDDEIFERLTAIFRDIFDDDTLVLTRATNADHIEEWDSLNQIKIILAAEKAFGRPLNARKISTLENVGEMVDYLHSELNG